ncbi:MAG: TRAP transporter TatT component family protein [Elusimicrobiota bacterium]
MRKAILLALGAAALSACSIDRMALRSVVGVLERGRLSALDEPDWQTAREAMASQLKLLETLLVGDPANRALLRLAAESFGGSAFLFLEDAEPARAKGFYLRGRDHALAALALKRPLRDLASKTIDDFENALETATGDDVPDLFWTGFCWGGSINLSKDDASALGDLPKVAAVMKRVGELAPSYHFAGVDLFFGVYYASRPAMLGGDPRKAKAHFDAAQRSTNGRYLMAHVLNARWYAVAVQDRALFEQLLRKTLESPAGLLPQARLTDEAAKRKAAVLLEKIDDYF